MMSTTVIEVVPWLEVWKQTRRFVVLDEAPRIANQRLVGALWDKKRDDVLAAFTKGYKGKFWSVCLQKFSNLFQHCASPVLRCFLYAYIIPLHSNAYFVFSSKHWGLLFSFGVRSFLAIFVLNLYVALVEHRWTREKLIMCRLLK